MRHRTDCRGHILDNAILTSRHARVLAHPHDALYGAVVRERGTALGEVLGLCIRSTQIEHPHLLFLPASEQMRTAGGDGDAPDDVIVREGLETFAGVRVLDFTNQVKGQVQ